MPEEGTKTNATPKNKTFVRNLLGVKYGGRREETNEDDQDWPSSDDIQE